MAKNFFADNYPIIKYSALSPRYKKLLLEAKKAMKNAYDPYKNYKVGSALLTNSGRIISAANVANSSYINSTCAERSAVAKANSMGERRFKAIAVIGKPGNGENYVLTPCGACRQIIYEFARYSDRDIEVIMSNGTMDKIIVLRISALLPLAHR